METTNATNDKQETKIVNQNSDFLFIYEATMCNPNGDPDQENKPRMDYETKTNLVSDVRIKRYIRDYLISKGNEIFVSMDNEKKVSNNTKYKNYLINSISNDKKFNELCKKKLLSKNFDKNKFLQDSNKYITTLDEKEAEKYLKEINTKYPDINENLLEELVKSYLIDIRMFGSAFAIKGPTKIFTGPIQINWGYSLNPVDLIKSNSIVTIMNDDNSTFGNDYRVHYSLIAIHGTINKHFAVKSGLTYGDLDVFRDAMINAIPALPTRSKMNQYPLLYLELQYQENSNKYLKDLRNYVNCKPKQVNGKEVPIRKYSDLDLDFSELISLIDVNKQDIDKCYLWKSDQLGDLKINLNGKLNNL